jgi:HD-like signal output (HDOD) protein
LIRETTSSSKSVAQEILSAAQRGELALPPLPAIVTRLLEMIRDEVHADLGEVSQLMLDDPAITTSVLRIANSAAFAGIAPAQDLEAGIQRLGLRQVGTLVTSIAHRGNFQSRNPARLAVLERLWEHSMVSALAARQFASRPAEGAGPGDRAEAYLAGLLHDTGKLVVLKGLDRIESRTPEARFTSEDVEELMEALHTVLGFSALRSWRIDDRICRVALHHHDEGQAAGDRLLMQVRAADVIARRLCAQRDSDRDFDLLRAQAIAALAIEAEELSEIVAAVEVEIERARSLFD